MSSARKPSTVADNLTRGAGSSPRRRRVRRVPKPRIAPLAAAQAEPRVLYAARELLRWRPAAVTRMIMTTFGVSQTTSERDIAEAKALLDAEASVERPLLRARVMRQLQWIADREEERDPRAAIDALTTLARLAGLFSPQEAVVANAATPEQIATVIALQLSPHERRLRIAELKARELAEPIDVVVNGHADGDN